MDVDRSGVVFVVDSVGDHDYGCGGGGGGGGDDYNRQEVMYLIVAMAVAVVVIIGAILWLMRGRTSCGCDGAAAEQDVDYPTLAGPHVIEGLTSLDSPITNADPTRLSIDTLKPTSTTSITDSTSVGEISSTSAGAGGGLVGLSPATVPPPPLSSDSTVTTNVPYDQSSVAPTPEEQAAAAIAATAGACLPPDGEGWGKPGGVNGSTLNSACGQPPNYEILDKTYPTCEANIGGSKATSACLGECCNQCSQNRGKYDPTWYQMCMAGCSLCCNNETDAHFSKHGPCFNYVNAQSSVAKTSDAPGMFSPSNWRGYITAFRASGSGM